MKAQNEMTLHSIVTVKLTQKGADILNKKNRFENEAFSDLGFKEKTDYVAGDAFTDMLWRVMQLFGPYCGIGESNTFTSLTHAE